MYNDAADKSEYYTPNPLLAVVKTTCSLPSQRFDIHLWLSDVRPHCCKKESEFLQNESQAPY